MNSWLRRDFNRELPDSHLSLLAPRYACSKATPDWFLRDFFPSLCNNSFLVLSHRKGLCLRASQQPSHFFFFFALGCAKNVVAVESIKAWTHLKTPFHLGPTKQGSGSTLCWQRGKIQSRLWLMGEGVVHFSVLWSALLACQTSRVQPLAKERLSVAEEMWPISVERAGSHGPMDQLCIKPPMVSSSNHPHAVGLTREMARTTWKGF